uniref:Carboxypeptidase M n=1 Tax=Lygus hesperus TaxID=30085 RepID=A0A146LLR8_LYGHE
MPFHPTTGRYKAASPLPLSPTPTALSSEYFVLAFSCVKPSGGMSTAKGVSCGIEAVSVITFPTLTSTSSRLELSCCKYPGDHELEKHWNDNKKALLSFLKYSQQGVKGVIYNGTDEPVSKAAVSIYGRKQVHYSTENGEYWILLLPGKYWLEVEKFEKKIFRKITVPDSPFDNPLILNLDLATAAAEDYPQPSDFDPEQDNTGDFLMVGVDRKDAQEYEEIHEAMVNERKNMNEDERYDDETLPYPGDSRAADTYRLNSFICIICSIFSLLFCK